MSCLEFADLAEVLTPFDLGYRLKKIRKAFKIFRNEKVL